MIDEVYRNAFKEVFEILQNTENNLVDRIPTKFMNFLKDNMNVNYKTNISSSIDIDKQDLLQETEAILSLIYRNYWATDEEKKEFAIKDKNESIEKEKRVLYQESQIFNRQKNRNNVTLENDLIVIPKDNFIKRCIKKILNIFRKK